jgi:CheY-like chemotaxis protein
MSKIHSVLIVDDDADDREIIRDAFQTNDRESDYIFIENGERLMEYLENCDILPSLIMLDLNMPGKDGREALKDIKSNTGFRQIPIIVFTTSSSHKDRQMSYDLGANCFITKPDTFNKLVDLTMSIGRLWLSANGA